MADSADKTQDEAMQAIDRLVEQFGEDIAKEIAVTYASEAGQHLDSLLSDDVVIVARSAHTLKGDSPLLGFHTVAAVAGEIDGAHKSGQDLPQDRVDHLRELLQQAIDIVNGRFA